MKKSPINYRAAFSALQGIVDLKIRKNKVNFTAQEKIKINKTVKALIKEGVLLFDEDENKYVPVVKFVKTGKKEKVKGIKSELLGRFVRGARPQQKMRGNKIITDHAEKIFIPLDLSFLEEHDENGEVYEESDIEGFINETLYDVSYMEDLSRADYFTIAVANGWEIGRGNFRASMQRPKNIKAKNRILEQKEKRINKYAEEQMPPSAKIKSLSRAIAEIVLRIWRRNVNKYKLGLETISGVYLYKFVKQRKPNKKEKKAIKRKGGKK